MAAHLSLVPLDDTTTRPAMAFEVADVVRLLEQLSGVVAPSLHVVR